MKSRFFEAYAKHTALNLGQALQGLRYVYSHPDVDLSAPRGSAKHLGLSLLKRGKLIANDLFFAAIPPHWHHTPEEIQAFRGVPMGRWFLYGYCAWRFGETGEPKPLTGNEDPRWDPRCR
jgi:hypothetical protein